MTTYAKIDDRMLPPVAQNRLGAFETTVDVAVVDYNANMKEVPSFDIDMAAWRSADHVMVNNAEHHHEASPHIFDIFDKMPENPSSFRDIDADRTIDR